MRSVAENSVAGFNADNKNAGRNERPRSEKLPPD
jgi:hypothetical protein